LGGGAPDGLERGAGVVGAAWVALGGRGDVEVRAVTLGRWTPPGLRFPLMNYVVLDRSREGLVQAWVRTILGQAEQAKAGQRAYPLGQPAEWTVAAGTAEFVEQRSVDRFTVDDH